jgi:mono/diheme cytochrome c family protein
MRPAWLLILAALTCSGAQADDDPLPLKAGTGGDITAVMCNACHTSDYIVMNSVFLSAANWKAEVSKMRTVFGAPIDEETAEFITDYLGASYAAKPAKSSSSP